MSKLQRKTIRYNDCFKRKIVKEVSQGMSMSEASRNISMTEESHCDKYLLYRTFRNYQSAIRACKEAIELYISSSTLDIKI